MSRVRVRIKSHFSFVLRFGTQKLTFPASSKSLLMSMCMSVFVHLQNRQAAVQRGLGWCETSKVSLIRRYHRLKQLFSYLVLSRGQN